MDTPAALLAKPEDAGMFRGLWERHQRSHGGGSGTPGHGPSRNNSKGDLAALADAAAAEEGATAGAAVDKGKSKDAQGAGSST